MLLAASTLLVVARRGHRATAALALGVFLLIHAVTGNTAYLRSDNLALCFSVWAVVTVARADTRRGVVAAGVLAALAIAAKQSFLAAGVVCLLHVGMRRPRDVPAFLLAGITVGAVLGVVATLYWGPDFWLAVTIPLTDYPRDIESYWAHWRMMLAQPLVLFTFGTAVVCTTTAVVREGWRGLASPYFTYLVVAWVLQNAVMTGIGAENHNLIEPMLATLLWIVAASQRADAPLRIGWVYAAGLAGLAYCLMLELRNPNAHLYSYTDSAHTEQYVRDRAAAQAVLRNLGIEHGRMLNLKNSQIPHDFAGEMVLNDLWMYVTVLWNSRPETVDRLVAAIDAEYFDAVIVSPGVVTADYERGDGPWPRIVRAVFAHYTLAHHGRELNLLARRIPRPR
jgi:hypothetical protein